MSCCHHLNHCLLSKIIKDEKNDAKTWMCCLIAVTTKMNTTKN